MAQIETWLNQDMMQAVKVRYLDGNLFSQDNAGNLIGVKLTRDGEDYSGGGTVSANVIRADGGTVAVTGALSGNVATVVLPQSAYAVPGVASIVVKLTVSGAIITIAAVVANIYQSSTETAIDPGTIIPSIQTLINQIDTAVASIPADYSSLWTSIAPAFSTSTAYTAGQYVTYNGGLYRFTANHAAGAWSSSDVSAVVLGNELSDLKSALNNYQIVTSYERKGLSTSDGSESSATNKVSSGFCPCSMATLVRVKGKMNGISVAFRAYFYDSNKTYICNIESSLTDIETEDLMCAFVKSAYVRFMFYSTDTSIELLPEDITSRFSVSYCDNSIYGKEKEEIDNTGIVRCNWCYGSAYAASGLPYMDRSRAISRPIPVKENEILQINCATGISLRIFKFKSDGTFITYSNTTHPQNYITETNVAYIVIGQQSITNIETAQNTVFVRKSSNEEKRILDTLITNPVGIIPVLWDRGGLLVATGEETSSSTRIRSGFIPVPASKRIMIHNPNAKFAIRIFAYDSNSAYQQDYQAGVHGSVEENYFTDFDILLKDNISFIRILARKNENPETTVLDKNDGNEIIVYSETGLNHFDYDDEYADYVLEESNNVMDKLNNVTSDNVFTMVAVSDLHFWYNSNMVGRALNDMKNAVKYIRMIENPDIAVSFGDVIYRWYAQYLYSAGKNEMLASVRLLNDSFEDSKQLRLVGNHDANSLQKDKYFTMEEIYKYVGSHNTDIVIDEQNATGCYGYTDVASKKIRIVYLNTSDFSDEGAPPFEGREGATDINKAPLYLMSYRQVEWFSDVIKLNDKSDADEWTLIVLSHIPLDESERLKPSVGMNVFLLLTDRKTLASHSYTVKGQSLSVNYTNCEKLKDIVYIHGHNHDYDLSVTDGIVKAGIPNALPLRNAQSMSKVALTKDSTAFCVLKFDLAKKVIHAIHYGKGYDRVVHYNEMEVSTSTTVTPIQTNTSYISSDTSVATVTSGGVITPVAAGYAYITGTDANGNKELWNVHVTA